MNDRISLIFRAAESDAPGDDEYASMAANAALVLVGARRAARLDRGIRRDGRLWRALAATRGHRLVSWDDGPGGESAWTEPLFVKAKHAKEAEAMRGVEDDVGRDAGRDVGRDVGRDAGRDAGRDDVGRDAWRLMGDLLGYPAFCGRRGDGRRGDGRRGDGRRGEGRRARGKTDLAELHVRIQRGQGSPSQPQQIAAVAHCQGREVARAAAALQSWADAGNRAMCGVAFGNEIRVHFSAGVGRY
jgi:hypothetical protein